MAKDEDRKGQQGDHEPSSEGGGEPLPILVLRTEAERKELKDGTCYSVTDWEVLRHGLAWAGITTWTWDLKTRELVIDDLAENHPFYYPASQATTWEEIAHEDDRERVLDALQSCEQSRYVAFDCCFRLATEIPRWVHARDTRLLLDINEKPLTLWGLFFDVTEGELEKERLFWGRQLLKESMHDKVNWLRTSSELDRHMKDFERIFEIKMQCQEHFDSLLGLSDIPAFRKNIHLEYTEVNEAMERLLGLTSEQIINRTDEEIWGKESAEHLKRLCDRVLKGESVFENHTRTINGQRLEFTDEFHPEWSTDYVTRGLDFEDTGVGVSGICGTMFFLTAREDTDDDSVRRRLDRIAPIMRPIYLRVGLAAKNDHIVLLTGESGTGKDYFARRIHDLSRRASEPFEILNCAALPRELVESELFGFEKGAHNQAERARKGFLEVVGKGTAVLDEIGDMPLELQSKLLTFLDTRRFRRLGGEKDVHCEARIIATTNVDLRQAITAGLFRKDLYYRINVLSIHVPPLRQRPEEIPSILRGLMRSLARSLGLEQIPRIDGFAMKKLLGYQWPGNIRELTNVLERAIAHAAGEQIGPEHIIFDTQEETPPAELDSEHGLTSTNAQAAGVTRNIGTSDSYSADSLGLPVPLRNPSDEQIRALHEEYSVRSGESSTDLAKRYGVTSSTVRHWFKKLGLTGRKAGRPNKKRVD